jgi:dihydrofolate reductase
MEALARSKGAFGTVTPKKHFRMKEIKVFIAMTIDGFIAREDHSLDWLDVFSSAGQEDYGYERFIQSVGTLVMGRNTYEAILGAGVDWPYGRCETYVLTQRPDYTVRTPRTHVLNQFGDVVVRSLRRKSTGNVWIVGGGGIITNLLAANQVDELLISVMPLVLGNGIRLFPGAGNTMPLELAELTRFNNGVVNLKYRRRKKA